MFVPLIADASLAAPPTPPGPEPGRPMPVPLMPTPSFAARGVATGAGLALVIALDGAEFGETRLAGPLFVGWIFKAARGAPAETIGPDALSARWAKLTFAASAMNTNTAHGVRQGFQCKKCNMSIRTVRFTIDRRPELLVMSRPDPVPRHAPGYDQLRSLETSSAAPARPRAT
jgi:hypothetical protein